MNIEKKLLKGCNRIFVIGYIGTDRIGVAQDIAMETGCSYVNLDEFITKKDGRSIMRITMEMGEHEYRNKEYEALLDLSKEENVIVACGDGVVLDDMSLEILEKNSVIFVDDDLDTMFRMSKDQSYPYSFMCDTTLNEKIKFAKFCELYEVRKPLYLKGVSK